jgi:hypothetical protein
MRSNHPPNCLIADPEQCRDLRDRAHLHIPHAANLDLLGGREGRGPNQNKMVAARAIADRKAAAESGPNQFCEKSQASNGTPALK